MVRRTYFRAGGERARDDRFSAVSLGRADRPIQSHSENRVIRPTMVYHGLIIDPARSVQGATTAPPFFWLNANSRRILYRNLCSEKLRWTTLRSDPGPHIVNRLGSRVSVAVLSPVQGFRKDGIHHPFFQFVRALQVPKPIARINDRRRCGLCR